MNILKIHEKTTEIKENTYETKKVNNIWYSIVLLFKWIEYDLHWRVKKINSFNYISIDYILIVKYMNNAKVNREVNEKINNLKISNLCFLFAVDFSATSTNFEWQKEKLQEKENKKTRKFQYLFAFWSCFGMQKGTAHAIKDQN